MKLCLTMIIALVWLPFVAAGEQPAMPGKVLILSESTRFKNALVGTMQTLLRDRGLDVAVETNSRRNINNYKATAFDVVFITNSGVNSKVRPWVVSWLADNKAYAARILLHTTQTRDWDVEADVDAVTSASNMGAVEDLANRYVLRLVALMTPDGDAVQ